jgi:hypothetical protein
MLHCVFVISAGFLAPANIKHRSAAVPFARSPGLYASVPTEDFDDVELRFRDMEDAEKSAPAASTESAQAFTKTSAPVVALMEKHSFPLGLAQRAVASAKNSPVRFWAVDNSGSMGIPDGQRLGKDSGGNFKVIQSTRWQELTDDIESVAALSSTIGSRTEFYLINPGASPPLIITGDGRPGEVEAVRAGLGAPTGTTPLAETTKRIADKISAMVDQSLLVGLEKACVVIATDGKPDDEGAFESAVKRLLKLPVWLVFRLCTNDDDVLGYYNELDAQLEADIEVIDDLHGEALEIAQAGNTWLTYGPPMQLARFGMQDQIFDLIDETELLPSQIKTFCEALLGCSSLPEPELDTQAFIASIEEQLALQPNVFDPSSGKVLPWIKTEFLKARLS